MTEQRWSKFWWQDYEADPALRLVSLAAQGLWMRMLCAMHRGDPYGHLTVGDKPMTTDQLASLVGARKPDVVKLLAELHLGGVFSKTGYGVMFSRRLVRDRELSDLGRVRGKQGGNPALIRQDNHKAEGGQAGGGLTSTLKPEAEAEAERKKAKPPLTPQNGNRQPDPMGTGMADLGSEDGRPTCGGFFVDSLFEDCCAAAGINSVASVATWQPLIAWLTEGHTEWGILRVIKQISGRPGYKPPRTLEYFSRAVREGAKVGERPG